MNLTRWLALMAVMLIGGCAGLPEPASTPATTAEPSPTSVATNRPTVAPAPTDAPLTPPSSPDATSGPAPEPTAVPVATVKPTEAPDAAETLVVDWRRQSDDPGMGILGDEYPYLSPSSIVFDGRFVILGNRNDLAERYSYVDIWTSSDGASWADASVERITRPAYIEGGYQTLSDVVAGGPGLVAVGTDYECCVGGATAAIWVSADADIWTRVDDDDLRFTGPLSWIWQESDRLLAYGDDRLLSSVDGANWEPVEIDTGPDIFDAPAIKTDDGLITFASDGEGSLISAWRLTGRGWERLNELPESERVTVNAAAAGPRGWVVSGTQYSRRESNGVAWWSADGDEWQRAVVAPGLVATDMLADDAGFIAAGYHPPGGCALDSTTYRGWTWTSVDGLTWREMEGGDWTDRAIYVLLRNGRTLIGAGVDFDNEQELGVGAIWTADLPPTQYNDDEPASPTEGYPVGCGE